ncbi:DUF2637 domain-containing protein [Streptomyces sp. NPDC058861]|uniref:DUF2637 domain-containing protein n=1 Tax=Streptomyces sp. NPDC058861 TaxID=3346653 RepID=UPI00369F3CB9
MLTEETADRYVLIAAGAVIIVLTGSGFWLSYAHLGQIAGQHGLGSSPSRQWAWPATLDAFIVAGELLMLRAGLRRVTDWWAIAMTGVGSLGSIALNVAGVSGTNDGPVPPLDYVVAAVPPTGAMLAFGVLMRQIHQRLVHPAHRSTIGPNDLPEADEQAASGPNDDAPPQDLDHQWAEPEAGPNPDQNHPDPEPGPNPEPGPSPDPGRPDSDRTRTGDNPDPDPEPGPNPEPGPDPDHQRTELEAGPNPDQNHPDPEPGPNPDRQRTVRGRAERRHRPRPGPDRLSEDEVVELVLPHIPAVLVKDGNRRVTRAQLRGVMRAHGITLGNEYLGSVLNRVRATTTPDSMEGAPR